MTIDTNAMISIAEKIASTERHIEYIRMPY